MITALCNEVLRELDFTAQFALARRLGYDGLEIAPFTLSEAPTGCPPRGAHAHPLPRAAGIMA
jgi:D-psicose/D-tagatose/L-ribulose 3-epimerase